MPHCRIHDSQGWGVIFSAQGKGRLEGCEVCGNGGGGIKISGDNPSIVACVISDHAGGGRERGSGCGVCVGPGAAGMATEVAACVFARNAGGDIFLEEDE